MYTGIHKATQQRQLYSKSNHRPKIDDFDANVFLRCACVVFMATITPPHPTLAAEAAELTYTKDLFTGVTHGLPRQQDAATDSNK